MPRPIVLVLLLALFCGGCTDRVIRFQKSDTDATVHELRTELSDLRHAMHAQNVELQLVQEGLRDREPEIGNVEKRLAEIFKLQKKLDADFRELALHVENHGRLLAGMEARYRECQSTIAQHAQRLDDIKALKGTLHSVSKAIAARATPAGSTGSSYEVQPGDSLEKISRRYRMSVDLLKRANHLSGDMIYPGQVLILPSDAQNVSLR